MNPIELAGLTVRYGRRTALDAVSLEVGEGGVYALLGRNGAGKSSLVRCLLGEQRSTAGSCRLFGRDVWRERAALLAEVGVVPEEPDVPPAMTVEQVERFCSRLYPRWDGAGLRGRLRRFRVPLDVPFGRLSKGQKGHVAFALALAPNPSLLILDDPTLGLDAVAKKSVFDELIGELADRGTTVFLTTHDLAEVERIADRVGVLYSGRLVLDEPLEVVKGRFRRVSFAHPAAAGGVAAPASRLEELVPLAGLAPVAVAARGWGVEAVVSRYDEERFSRAREGELAADRAEVSVLTLEEIFVALTGEPAEAAP
jgi:ABC-2 type transport system ATP-binding protein